MLAEAVQKRVVERRRHGRAGRRDTRSLGNRAVAQSPRWSESATSEDAEAKQRQAHPQELTAAGAPWFPLSQL